MDPATLMTIIQMGGTLLDSIFTAANQRGNMRYMNTYNSPQNQRMRLQAAGYSSNALLGQYSSQQSAAPTGPELKSGLKEGAMAYFTQQLLKQQVEEKGTQIDINKQSLELLKHQTESAGAQAMMDLAKSKYMLSPFLEGESGTNRFYDIFDVEQQQRQSQLRLSNLNGDLQQIDKATRGQINDAQLSILTASHTVKLLESKGIDLDNAFKRVRNEYQRRGLENELKLIEERITAYQHDNEVRKWKAHYAKDAAEVTFNQLVTVEAAARLNFEDLSSFYRWKRGVRAKFEEDGTVSFAELTKYNNYFGGQPFNLGGLIGNIPGASFLFGSTPSPGGGSYGSATYPFYK